LVKLWRIKKWCHFLGHPVVSKYVDFSHQRIYAPFTNVYSGCLHQVTIVNREQRVRPVKSYSCELYFACFVFWFCDPLFGLIAFFLAGAPVTSLSSLPLPGRVVNETCDAETETRPRRSKNARDRLEIDTTTLLPSTVG